MISTGDVKKGIIIELDGQLMKVLDWTHIKMARGSAQVRMKLQNVRKGDIVERTFQAGTRWPRARVEQRKVQYLYHDGGVYHFMDTETYDQIAVSAAMIGDDRLYLKENTDVFVSSHEGEVLGVDVADGLAVGDPAPSYDHVAAVEDVHQRTRGANRDRSLTTTGGEHWRPSCAPTTRMESRTRCSVSPTSSSRRSGKSSTSSTTMSGPTSATATPATSRGSSRSSADWL